MFIRESKHELPLEICGKLVLVVLVLLLECQHHSLEARVHLFLHLISYLFLDKQSILLYYVLDEQVVLWVVLRIFAVLQVVYPVVLWVVFNVRQLIVDFLHY